MKDVSVGVLGSGSEIHLQAGGNDFFPHVISDRVTQGPTGMLTTTRT